MGIRLFFTALTLLLTGCGPGSVESREWILTEAGGEPVRLADADKTVYMFLGAREEEQNLEGFAGCNSLGGSYRLEGRRAIRFEPITTRMLCEGGMEVENLFLRILADADAYAVKGNSLLLYRGDTLLGKFRAGSSAER